MGATEAHSPDNFGSSMALFRPPEPSPELALWLWHLTPPTAPTVPVLESRTRDDDRYGGRDPGRVPVRDDGPGHVPLLRHDRGIRSAHERLQLVRETLPPGVRRQPDHHRPTIGKPRWEIESAFFHDVCGYSNLEIADALDFTDHKKQTWGSRSPESRSARRYVEDGRKALAALGAWPWTLEENGKVDARGWWRDDRFAIALFGWHEEATVMAINDALLAADCLSGQETYRTNGDRLATATRLYRERLDRAVRSRAPSVRQPDTR
jgi:hypothetical protein